MGIKGNTETDKAAKQAIDMPGMTIKRPTHTDHYLTIKRARRLETPNGKGNEKTILVSYTTLNHAPKNGEVPTTFVSNMRSN